MPHQPDIDDREHRVEHDEHRKAEHQLAGRRCRRDRIGRLLQAPDDPGLAAGLGQDPAGEAGEEGQRDPTDRSPLEPFRLDDVPAPEKPRAPESEEEHQAAEVRHHPHPPVREPDHRHVVPRPELRFVLRLVLVQADDLAVERAGSQIGKKPGISIEKRRRRIALREAADLEERERGRLLGVPECLRGGDLHRLRVRRLDPERVPPPELERGQRHQQHDRELRGRTKDIDVAALSKMPRGDAEHDEAAGEEAGQDHMHVGVDRELLEQDRGDVVRLGPIRRRVDLVADRMLHPRVGDDDEVRGQPGPRPDEVDRREVHLRCQAIATEHPEPDEARLEHESAEALDGQRPPEDVADVLRERRPVHPELELLHQARRHADREVDQEERAEEPHQPLPLGVLRPIRQRLHDREQRRESERQRHKDEVVQGRERELQARQIERRHGENVHPRGHRLRGPRREAPVAPERIARLEADDVATGAKCLRRARHRLDRHAAAAHVGPVVAGVQHQVRIRLVHPEHHAGAAVPSARERGAGEAVIAASQIGEAVIEPRPAERPRPQEVEFRPLDRGGGAGNAVRVDLEDASGGELKQRRVDDRRAGTKIRVGAGTERARIATDVGRRRRDPQPLHRKRVFDRDRERERVPGLWVQVVPDDDAVLLPFGHAPWGPANETVDRGAGAWLVYGQLQISAGERVRASREPVRPGHEHLATARGTHLARAVAVDQFAVSGGVGTKPAADLDHGDSLFGKRDLELLARGAEQRLSLLQPVE